MLLTTTCEWRIGAIFIETISFPQMIKQQGSIHDCLNIFYRYRKIDEHSISESPHIFKIYGKGLVTLSTAYLKLK